MAKHANGPTRTTYPLPVGPEAPRSLAVVGWVVGLSVVFVVVVVGGVVWQIAGRSDPAVERLVAQTQLIGATLGLFLSTMLTAATLYYAALTRRMANAAVASVEHQVLDRTRAQADHVSAWVTAIDSPTDRPGLHEDAGNNGKQLVARVAVRNASPVPVFSCTVLVRPHWGAFPPTSHVDAGSGRFWAVLPPGDVAEWLDAEPAADLLSLPPVDIIFTDAGGLHWLRRGNGNLESLDENPGGAC